MQQLPQTSSKALWPQAQILDPKFWDRTQDLEALELDNGLRVIISTDERDRSTYLEMCVNAGAVHQDPQLRGIPHFMEHMLFQGTERFKNSLQLIEFIEDYNLAHNGYVAPYHQGYHVECDNDQESVKAAFTYLDEIIFKSTFPEEAIARQQEVVVAEYETLQSNPDQVALQEFMNHFYGYDHQFAEGGILGYPEEIRKFTRQQVVDFYRQYFSPENMVLVIAGGLSGEQYKQLVQEYFSSYESKSQWKVNPDLGKERQGAKRVTEIKKDFNHVAVDTALYFDRSELTLFSEEDVALNMAAQILSTRLFLDLREEQGLAYSVHAWTQFFSHGVAFATTGEFPVEKYQQGRKQLEAAFQRLLQVPITEQEFQRALRSGKSIRWANSARRIALRISNRLMMYGQLLSPEFHHHLYDKLSVEKLNEVVKQKIEGEDVEVVAVGKID